MSFRNASLWSIIQYIFKHRTKLCNTGMILTHVMILISFELKYIFFPWALYFFAQIRIERNNPFIRCKKKKAHFFVLGFGSRTIYHLVFYDTMDSLHPSRQLWGSILFEKVFLHFFIPKASLTIHGLLGLISPHHTFGNNVIQFLIVTLVRHFCWSIESIKTQKNVDMW